MKLFGILATICLAKANFMSVFEARESVSNLATTLFNELADDVENFNGKILFDYF